VLKVVHRVLGRPQHRLSGCLSVLSSGLLAETPGRRAAARRREASWARAGQASVTTQRSGFQTVFPSPAATAFWRLPASGV